MIPNAFIKNLLATPPLSGAVAVACGCGMVLIPTAARLLIDPVVSGTTFAAYYPFVLLSAVLMTWRSAFAVTVVSALTANFLFMAPRYEFLATTTDTLGTAFFVLCAMIVLAVGQSLKRAVWPGPGCIATNENRMLPGIGSAPIWTGISQAGLAASGQPSFLGKAERTLEDRQLRKTFLNPAMVGEPGFDMLLALYVAAPSSSLSVHALRSPIGVSSLVAVRWLKFLVNEGLVLVIDGPKPDDLDANSATLTEQGKIALDEYFRSCRPL